jgi:L-iditol 2-dehydrogenase
MRALCKISNDPKAVQLMDVEVPQPVGNQILIKVLYAGVGEIDLDIYQGLENCKKLPVVMGREFCGEVIELGKEAKGFQIGDKVSFYGHMETCGVCDNCTNNTGSQRHICKFQKRLGIDYDGGFAEYFVGANDLAAKLPNGCASDEGVLLEPAARMCQALLIRGQMQAMDRVGIIGAGPYGILAAQIARACGAMDVYVFGSAREEERLAICQELGLKTFIMEDTENVKRFQKNLDIAVETTGKAEPTQFAINLLNKFRKLIVTKIPHEEKTDIPWNVLVRSSIRVVSSIGADADAWYLATKHYEAGKLQFKPLISDIAAIEDHESVFERVAGAKELEILFKF